MFVPNSDKGTGAVLLLIFGATFVYYTLWVVVTPFVEDGHALLTIFPDRSWAIIIPVMVLVVAVSSVGAFLALVMIQSAKKLPPPPPPATPAFASAAASARAGAGVRPHQN